MDEIISILTSIDVDAELAKLEQDKAELVSACIDLSIPFAVGSVTQGSDSNFVLGIEMAISEAPSLREWLAKCPPSFVGIIPKIAHHCDGCFGLSGSLLARELAVRNLMDVVLEKQKQVDQKVVGYEVLAIFAGGSVRVSRSILSGAWLLCPMTRPEPDEDEDEDFSYDDDFDDSPEPLDEGEINDKALVLANSDGFSISRNQAERTHLAQKLFGDEIGHWDIERIARAAAPVYKLEVLPTKVRELSAIGLEPKEIAARIGESLAKVKQILATT